MGGSNPYIEETKYTPATKKFKVTFLPSGKTIEVDPAQIPYGHNGLPGSILDFSEALKAGPGPAGGGVCASPTPHVIGRGSPPPRPPPAEAAPPRPDAAPRPPPNTRPPGPKGPDGPERALA